MAASVEPAGTYDVAVLGSHLTAGLLGAVLARQGLRVLLVPVADGAGETAGETTVPYTSEVFLLIAKRFRVPEIAAFGRFADLPESVRSSSGVKKSLGFLYHHPGRPQDPAESMQFNVPGEHGEWHPSRSSLDACAMELAVRYGAVAAADGAVLVDAWVEGGLGHVRTDDGGLHHSRFVVDCAGSASPLVRRNGGFDAEPRSGLRSRVLATHMEGVLRYEQVVPIARSGAGPSAWSQGTVHHLFEGGWLQLADFGNHAGSTNPRVGVTLSLDREAAVGLPEDPELAFRAVVARFPDVARQFASAVAARPWTVEPVTQRTAARTHGERWFALERSAGHNDTFLARDITMGAELVHALASVLIPAAHEDDYAVERFAPVARFQEELAAFHDRILCAARTACRSFPLWNAFARVWLLWQILADLSLKRARLDCESDPGGAWTAVERFEYGGIWFRVPEGLRELVDRALGTVEQAAGGLDPEQAADRIFADLRRSSFVPPLYAFGDPDARVYRFTFPKRLRMLWWTRTTAPDDFRRLLTRDNITSVASAAVR